MSFTFFPNLAPRNVNPSWFNADKPVDEESELTQLEQEHQTWVSLCHMKIFQLNFFSKLS